MTTTTTTTTNDDDENDDDDDDDDDDDARATQTACIMSHARWGRGRGGGWWTASACKDVAQRAS